MSEAKVCSGCGCEINEGNPSVTVQAASDGRWMYVLTATDSIDGVENVGLLCRACFLRKGIELFQKAEHEMYAAVTAGERG